MSEVTANPYEMFEINDEEENQVGIWAEYPVKGNPKRGFKVRFVHSGDSNTAYRDAIRARMKPLTYRMQQDMVSDEEFEELQQKVFADKIIKEWLVKDEKGVFVAGIYGNDFEILSVTRGNIEEAFKKAPRLFKDIKKQADQFATFKKETIKADTKN